jgi:hypothetical protein
MILAAIEPTSFRCPHKCLECFEIWLPHIINKKSNKKLTTLRYLPSFVSHVEQLCFLASCLQNIEIDLKNNLMHAPYAQKELHILPESWKERASFGPSIVLDAQKISLSGTRFCGPQCHRGGRKLLCLPSVQGSPCNAASNECRLASQSVISPASLLDGIPRLRSACRLKAKLTPAPSRCRPDRDRR